MQKNNSYCTGLGGERDINNHFLNNGMSIQICYLSQCCQQLEVNSLSMSQDSKYSIQVHLILAETP